MMLCEETPKSAIAWPSRTIFVFSVVLILLFCTHCSPNEYPKKERTGLFVNEFTVKETLEKRWTDRFALASHTRAHLYTHT